MSEDMSPSMSSLPLSRMAVVTSGYLPVPNVLGGAVEALDMMLVRENENHPCFDFTVFSTWTPDAERQAKIEGFCHTKFVFIKTPRVVRAIDQCIYAVAKNVLHRRKLMSYRYIAQRLWYISRVAKALAAETIDGRPVFDKIMIENHATLFMTLKKHGNAKRYAGRVYYHLHNEVTNDFGCKTEISQVRKVLGVSNYIIGTLDRFLRAHGEPGLSEDQKAVWRNGVDTAMFGTLEAEKQGKDLRAKYGIADDDVVFLFSGRLTPEKGAGELLKAFKRVAETNPRVKLVIAGAFFFNSNIASPFEQRLHELAEDPTVKKRIIFTGFVDYRDMPAVYAMSDVCVLPSIWDDPAPLAVIESLVSGKPLITTQSGGIPEYANDQCAIILERNEHLVVNLAQSMKELAGNPRRRSRLGYYEKSLAPKLSKESYISQFIRLVKQEEPKHD